MIATLGEALVDMIEQPDGRFQACLGGSVFNSAIGLARQGVPTAYLNPLSTDKFGGRFAALLAASDVLPAAPAPSARPTSLAIVSVDANGAPTYAFHRERVADRDVSAASLIDSFPLQMKLLHTGGLALVPEDGDTLLPALRAAAERGALISIDANLRPLVADDLPRYLGAVTQALKLAHIVKVSDEDLAHLGLDAADLEQVANALFHESSVQLIAVTRGGHAAALVSRVHRIEQPTPAGLALVDTVGAGDCFQAGLIACLYKAGALSGAAALQELDEATLRGALKHAICAASVNVTRAGCDPATWDQTVQFGVDWGQRLSAKIAA
ncbi:PfkB family carbohydrate kinase [Oxalobacteraceae bacterium OTU3REALA1]|nr:PfkB family carbohydrate kinase [Oxalobacteraceae bacterium OTU3REALA1]